MLTQDGLAGFVDIFWEILCSFLRLGVVVQDLFIATWRTLATGRSRVVEGRASPGENILEIVWEEIDNVLGPLFCCLGAPTSRNRFFKSLGTVPPSSTLMIIG